MCYQVSCTTHHAASMEWGWGMKACPGRDGGLWLQSQILGVRKMGNGIVDEALHMQVSFFLLGVIFVLFCLKKENQGRP